MSHKLNEAPKHCEWTCAKKPTALLRVGKVRRWLCDYHQWLIRNASQEPVRLIRRAELTNGNQ